MRAATLSPNRWLASGRTPIRLLLRSRVAAQALVYGGSNISMSALAAVSTALVARSLSSSAFGTFQFAVALLLFSSLFFDFGLFLPAARMAAREPQADRHRTVAAAVVWYVPVGLLFAAFIFGLSFVVDGLSNVHPGEALRATAAVTVAYPFFYIGLALTQGVGRLHIYSITTALSQALYVVLILATVSGVLPHLTTAEALALRSGAFLVGAVALVVWLRPVFSDVRRRMRAMRSQAREWGFNVYVGRVLSIGTYNMDVLMLGAFANARIVGFYALATAITAVIPNVIAGLASALFPRMANSESIDRRWLMSAWVVGVAGVVLAAVLARPAIELVFSNRYAHAYSYMMPLALAGAIRGVTTVYNEYLSSHAQGRDLRNAGLVLTGSNLILNFALIPPFGALGAAWASFIALVANYVAHVVFYRRSQGRAVIAA